jgi:CRP/FNR family cyclic AMP-dependent transcriptional regulator
MEASLTARRPNSPRRARPLAARVALVDVLPELDGPPASQRARNAVSAATVAVPRGIWDAAADATDPSIQGFMVVSGAILRRVEAGHREGAELLGAGDLIQPASESGSDITWRAVTDATLAVLDATVLANAGAVPELLAGLLTTAADRTNAVARQLVLAQWSSADDRLLATFRMLAERWGVVTPEGVALPAFLTHSVLAPLVGARRPSVTTALKRLAASGAVRRAADGRWLLARV